MGPRGWRRAAAVLLLLAGAHSCAPAAPLNLPADPRSLGTGCVLGASPLDGTLSANPAAGAWGASPAFAASHARPFGLAALDRASLSLFLPLHHLAAGLDLGGYGGELYAERRIAVRAALPLGPRLALGLAAGYTNVSIEGYGTSGSLSFSLGALLRLGGASAGIALDPVAAQPLAHFGNARQPRRGTLSLRVPVTGRLVLHADLAAEQARSRPETAVGMEAQLGHGLVLRGGYTASARRLHLGLGVTVAGLSATGSADHHPWLGWTRAFGIRWRGRE